MVSEVGAEEALGRLSPDERAWVCEFRERLRAELGPRLRDLRLFGSKARGDDHPESDIDLLVLVDQLDWPTWLAVSDLASEISSWLQPVTVDFEKYHAPRSRATGFYEEMRKESIRL